MIPKVIFKRILTAASLKLFNTEGKCEKVFFHHGRGRARSPALSKRSYNGGLRENFFGSINK